MFETVKEIINLTPHEVSLWVGDNIRRLPPSGGVARVHILSTPCGEVCGVPVVLSTHRRILGLPKPKDGTVFLVSSVVAKAVGRPDVLAPDTTDDGVIRDGTGGIVAVKRLQLFCGDTELV